MEEEFSQYRQICLALEGIENALWSRQIALLVCLEKGDGEGAARLRAEIATSEAILWKHRRLFASEPFR